MNFGHFNDPAREYVITRPDTPRSWSNYLGDTEYGGIITNNAGGYAFYRSAAQGRFLRLRFNSVPMDQPGRYVYLRDNESGDYWSSSWQPVGKPLEEFRTTCRHGTGYTVIASEYGGIATETTYFVPVGQTFEYWRLRIRNACERPRRLSLFTYCEFANNWDTAQDLVNLQFSQYCHQAIWREGMIRSAVLGNLPPDPDNFTNNDQGRWSFLCLTGADIRGYELDRERFLGRYRSYHNPETVERGQVSNSVADGDNACGCIHAAVELQPGEVREVLVLLGIGKAEEAGVRVRETYGHSDRCEQEFQKLKADWHGKLGAIQAQTPDQDFDHMVNVWNAYNALITFNWSRAASLVYNGERDGLGFRDTVQDIVAVAPLIPEIAQKRLELMLTGQDSRGGAWPVIKPFRHRPGQMGAVFEEEYRADDCLWFFNAVPVLVAETGNLGFYRKVLPYADRGEATVLGHLRRALEFNWERRGSHGLPSGLSADWNDCLKLGYKGESIFLTFQLRFALKTYAEICDELGEGEEAAWARELLEELDANIEACAWNGEWFVRAFREDGQVIGSNGDEDGESRIFLNAQSWAVLSGFADSERGQRAMDQVRKRLATEYGLMLCSPAYSRVPVDVIRAMVFYPGHKENGGIFCHPQGWAVMAETQLGRGDLAYDYYRAYMPAAYNDRAEIRESEPYVHCQSTRGRESAKFGTSRVPWLSGTAAWSYHAATAYILGLRAESKGLRLDPCLPSSWPGFTATRRFRGLWLRIEVKNPNGVCRGVTSLTRNGHPVEGNFLPAESLADGDRLVAVLG